MEQWLERYQAEMPVLAKLVLNDIVFAYSGNQMLRLVFMSYVNKLAMNIR